MTTDTTKIITLGVDIIALDKSIGLEYPNSKTEEYFVVVTLTNTQDTTVHFTTMTCSWSVSFIFDNDSAFLSDMCGDIDVPTSLEILPHKSVKFFGKLVWLKKGYDYKNPPSFKVGFADLPTKFFWESHSSTKERLKYMVYWSDNIVLRPMLYEFENHFKIGLGSR